MVKICEQCGKEFETKTGNKCCSEKCRRDKQKEKYMTSEQYAKRSSKAFTTHLKKKLIIKYGGKCAICGWSALPNSQVIIDGFVFSRNSDFKEQFGLDIHHIDHVKDGGNNNEDNLIVLCPNCHRLAHYGIYSKELLRNHINQKELTDNDYFEMKCRAVERIERIINEIEGVS